MVIILSSGSEVRGFDHGRGRWFFQSVKILSMTSFGREIKPWIPCRRFTARKRTSHFSSPYLRHSSLSNSSVASSTSQLILQPFRCFTYVTAYSPTLISLLLRHRLFTYVTWRVAHDAGQGISSPIRYS